VHAFGGGGGDFEVVVAAAPVGGAQAAAVEAEDEFVVAGLEMRREVHPQRAEHVVMLRERAMVEIDDRVEVEAVGDEETMLAGLERGGGERAAVVPVVVLDPASRERIAPSVDVGDPAGVHQIEIDGAGDLRVEPREAGQGAGEFGVGDELAVAVEAGELPGAVEVHERVGHLGTQVTVRRDRRCGRKI